LALTPKNLNLLPLIALVHISELQLCVISKTLGIDESSFALLSLDYILSNKFRRPLSFLMLVLGDYAIEKVQHTVALFSLCR